MSEEVAADGSRDVPSDESSRALVLGPGHLLMRHGATEANRRQVIQGRWNEYGLSPNGLVAIAESIRTNRASLAKVGQVVSSPAKRAVETAAEVTRTFSIEYATDDRLLEVDAGVLEGLSHADAAKKYPNEYAIWVARGDLDGIDGAESGDRLQARVVTFLHRYLEAPRSAELIVAHAAFNRCLYNTVYGLPRTQAVDCENGAIHPLPTISRVFVTRKGRARTAIVHEVRTADGMYIVKQSRRVATERLDLQRRILRSIQSPAYASPILLSTHSSESHTLRVLSHVPGIHRDGPLPAALVAPLVSAVASLADAMERLAPPLHSAGVLGLDAMLSAYIDSVRSREIHDHAMSLRASPLASKGPGDSMSLVSLDLHRSNILFDGLRLGFIDLETFVLAPKLMHLASLVVAALLLEEPDWGVARRAIEAWPRAVDLDALLHLMRIRALLGAAYFQRRIEQSESRAGDTVLLSRYLAVLAVLRRHV